jgi:hypothetical protein
MHPAPHAYPFAPLSHVLKADISPHKIWYNLYKARSILKDERTEQVQPRDQEVPK